MTPAVVLVRPREEGNIGAVARAMANMGLGRLILVEPAPQIGGVARGFGVGGWHILETCQRCDSFEEALAPFRRRVGTTSARRRPLHRSRLLAARELPTLLAADPPGTETALVFGPEDNGLSRRQLETCNPVVAVPCAPDHPTLNLAQSVLIVAYELLLAGDPTLPVATTEVDGPTPPATTTEVDGLLAQSRQVLDRLGYDQELVQARLVDELRRLLVRSDATSREVRVFRRLANRILQRARPGKPPSEPE